MPAALRSETDLLIDSRLRIDKWLFHARLCRTRALAQEKIRRDGIRINGRRIDKASSEVGPGDIVTLVVGREVLVVKVRELGLRRGSAAEAQDLYQRVQEKA